MTKLVTVSTHTNNGYAKGQVECTTVKCVNVNDNRGLHIIGIAEHQSDGIVAAAQIQDAVVSLTVETAQAVVDQLQRFIDAQDQ